MVTVMVIDDEPLAADNLRAKIESVAPHFRVETVCNPFAALEMLRREPPDIVFLDITMPELSGFELLGQLEERQRAFALVFCTAHTEYAIEAFDAAALDYIVKPAAADRVATAVQKAMSAIRGEWHRRFETSPLAAHLEKLVLRNSRGVTWLPATDIAYITSENHETIVYSSTNEELFSDMSLATIEGRLDPKRFFRCHRSAIVNLQTIVALDSRANAVTLSLPNGVEVRCPVSRRSKSLLKKRLKTR